MEKAITETERRRKKQQAYNEAHGIVPQTIRKDVREILEISGGKDGEKKEYTKQMSRADKEKRIAQLTAEMRAAAKILEFEHAAYLRDQIEKLRNSK